MFANSNKKLGSSESNIKVLKIRIKNCDAVLEDNDKDSNSYYVKSGALIEISDLTEDKLEKQNYIEDALKNYNMALKYDSKNSLYLIERAKCHIILGKNDLAQIDTEEASKLIPPGMMGNHIKTQIELVQEQLKQHQFRPFH